MQRVGTRSVQCMVRGGDLCGVCGCLQTGSYGSPLHGRHSHWLVKGTFTLYITQVGVRIVRFGSDSQAEDPFSFLASHNKRDSGEEKLISLWGLFSGHGA